VLEVGAALAPSDFAALDASTATVALLCRDFSANRPSLSAWRDLVVSRGWLLITALTPADVPSLAGELASLDARRLIVTLDDALAVPAAREHAVGRYRRLCDALRHANVTAPVWIRNTAGTAIQRDNSFLSRLLEASILTGALLCDGLGDLVSIETEMDVTRATKLAYNVLQGAGARISKTEFVACPSCGRTLFDLQSTTQRIRAQTGHLKGVKIAIMGCIVNGPGEMADADFGYVGGAPGKINLYVGKNCVQYNVPQAEADARLIALIKAHGKWQEAAPIVSGIS
jgi:(E)-4-hydroxy-3-methylbut-2-enyl-diphosphate synthase